MGQHSSASASRLLGLDGFEVLAAEVVGSEWRLAVQTTAELASCAGCGVRAEAHGRRPVRVRDLPIGGSSVVLGYISYYNAGFRVVRFNKKGIAEVGRFIDQGGNDFWGVFPIGDETVGHGYSGPIAGENPFVLASDRDFGLYIFRYTGS